MAIKKSQLYAKLWQSCNKLRGGIDASQYKDYILTLLFMKYVSYAIKQGMMQQLLTARCGCLNHGLTRMTRMTRLNVIRAKC